MKQVLLAAALAVLSPLSAFGLGGSLSSPELRFPDRATETTISAVLGYLRGDLTFIEGSFINEFTTQEFSGSATKVAGLIQLLQRSGFALTVQFHDLKDSRAALRISQNSIQEGTVLTINTACENFTLSDLKIELPARPTDPERE